MDTIIGPVPMRPVFRIETKESSLEDRAKEAIGSLLKIRENRQNLASGYQEVSYPDGTIRLMVDQLLDMEQGILNLFMGVSHEEVIHFQTFYMPDSSKTGSVTLAWLNKTQGILSRETKEAIPLRLQLKSGASLPEWKVAARKTSKKTLGLAYRIPVMAELKVVLGDDLLYEGHQMINQLGRTARLPYRIDKVELYPETGGLKNIR